MSEVSPRPFRILIAGSRTINDDALLLQALDEAWRQKILLGSNIEIVAGGALGVDSLAKKYALARNLPYTEFKPQYLSSDDRGAPLRRNVQMADYADVLVAIWDGKSSGTRHMIGQMEVRAKQVYIKYIHT